jgi:hypothetical protein
MSKIELIMGDWSDDGHGKSDRKIIESSISKAALLKAYKKGVELIGFDIGSMCADYEDSSIPLPCAVKFQELGVKFDQPLNEEEDECHCIYQTEFFACWMKTCEVGNPDLKWTELSTKDFIDIGGYGLFGS